MSQDIAVIGAGIAGLCSTLALAAKGNRITLYERDIPPPEGGPEEAFFEWQRRGAAQFRHPHAFLAVMCNILEENYPDLIEQFLAAGARQITFRDMLRPELLAKYEPEPEDEKMWLLMCRRATMETVLRRYVESQPNVELKNQIQITGINAEVKDGMVTVKSLQARVNREKIEDIQHDVYVDASGRNSKFPGWLSEHGATIDVEDDDADIVYYTRHYKLKPGEEEPSRHGNERSAGDLGYIKYGVFPGDNGHFAVIVCLPNHETELREAVKSDEQFDGICRSIPGLIPWVNETKSVATTSSFGFGDIHAVWRHFVHEDKPVALNYFAVGDSAVRTNPLYGRGCSTGIIHAHLLAEVLNTESDPIERALTFDARTEEELRPIFNVSLQEDKRGIKRAAAILNGEEIESTGSLKGWMRAAFGDALAAASRTEIDVLRGGMRTFNLMEKPGEFLKDSKIRWTVLKYMFRGRRNNAKSRYVKGPTRNEMLALVATMESERAA